MIKTGIVNNDPQIKKMDKEGIEKFAKVSNEELENATNEFAKACFNDSCDCGDDCTCKGDK